MTIQSSATNTQQYWCVVAPCRWQKQLKAVGMKVSPCVPAAWLALDWGARHAARLAARDAAFGVVSSVKLSPAHGVGFRAVVATMRVLPCGPPGVQSPLSRFSAAN